MKTLNRNFYKRINAIATEGQFYIEPMQLTSGNWYVLMWTNDCNTFGKMLAILRRKRNIVLDNYNYNTYSVRCFYPDDYVESKDFYEKQRKLLDIFWTAKHNGKSAEEAKQEQYEYAITHNTVDVYNSIYQTA